MLPGRGRTWVRTVGDGSTALVLLHGWTATAAVNWVHAFAPLAAAGHQVIGIDQRGHGRGLRPSPLRGFRLEDCADDVIAVADQLGLDRIVPVGYSMGGPVAQLVWHRHPHRVAGLVLCATARNFRGTAEVSAGRLALVGGVSGVAAALRTLPPGVRRQATRASVVWRKRSLGMPDWILEEIGRNDPAAMLEAFRALQSFNSSEWIGGVDVPAAVVVTTADHIVPPPRQAKLAAAIPSATVWPVDGDHDVCVTRPRAFAPTLVAACGAVMSSVAV